jgi:hypothetical protein
MFLKIVIFTLSLCLAISVTAQTSTSPARPAHEGATISDANFAVMAQHIRELARPEFRALLRERLLVLTNSSDSAERRQAALTLGAEALSDLCAQQESIQGTAFWLHESIAKALRNFGGADAEAIIARNQLKKDESPSPARDLSAAITSLKDSTKAASGREKAKAAILTGQVPYAEILGDLLTLRQSNSPHLPDLLSAVLTVEERQPGYIPLRMMPFFSTVFLSDSATREIQIRFLQTVVARTRNPRPSSLPGGSASEVKDSLTAIMRSTKTVAPDLYPEVAARLASLGSDALNPEREAAEARIKDSSDQLEQLQWEADHTNSAVYRQSYFARAASLALTQGKFSKAVDFSFAAYGDRVGDAVYLDRFLTNVTTAALKQQQPEAAEYAISKIVKSLARAENLIQMSKYYVNLKDTEKRKAALSNAIKSLDQSENNNDKLKVTAALAQASIPVDPSIAYEAMRLTVDTINKLPPPDDKKDGTSYRSFMPRAGELIDAYRLLAAQDEAAALALAQDIKFSELRVAALLGAYSKPASK